VSTTLFSMRLAVPLAYLAISFALPSLALGQGDGPMSLEEALRRAEEQSPTVVVARAQRDATVAFSVMGTQTRVRNPIVSMRAMIGQPDNPAATYQALVGVPFDLSQQRPVWKREARLLLARAEAELEATRNDARAEALAAYVAVAVAQGTLEVQEDRTEVIGSLLQRVEARVAQQASTAYDLALAQREYAIAQADFVAARSALEAARGRLRQALDLEPNDAPIADSLDAPAGSGGLTVDAAIAGALAYRREPVALELAAQRFRVSERRLRAQTVDPVFFGLEYEMQGNTTRYQTVGATMSFNLPFIFTNPGERAIAVASAGASDIEADVFERTVAREAATAHRLLALDLAELEVLETSAVPAAQRAVDMTEARLAAGAVDLFQVFINRRDLYATKLRRLEALQRAWLARIALDRAIGRRPLSEQ
jgi:outer membrane protein TolC